MKILIVIPAIGAVYGGPSKVALDLAAALARRGLEVDLVTTNADGGRVLNVPLGRWVDQDGFRVRYFPRGPGGEFKLSLSLLAWLVRHAGEYDAAHINSCFNFPVLAAALACRIRGAPYILAPHGMLEPWALGYKAEKKKLYLRWIEWPFVLRRASLIQALNENEAANIEALRLGPPVIVLPNGIGPEEARLPDRADADAFLERYPAARGKTVILFLHRVDPKKGLDLLAPAYAKAHAEFPRTHLVVAGPPSTPEYAEIARTFFWTAGVEDDAITFTGMLEGPLKRGALAAANVFVAPTYSEGFSMAVLEAMAAGLPCVITDGCNFAEAGEAGAARITAIESEAFGAGLSAVLADPVASRAMGARARALVLDEFTWDQIAGRLVEHCSTLLPAHEPNAA